MLYKPTAMLNKVPWTEKQIASPKNVPLALVQQYFFNAFQVSRAAAATSTNEVVKEIVGAAVTNSKEALRIANMYRLKDRNEKWLIPQVCMAMQPPLARPPAHYAHSVLRHLFAPRSPFLFTSSPSAPHSQYFFVLMLIHHTRRAVDPCAKCQRRPTTQGH